MANERLNPSMQEVLDIAHGGTGAVDVVGARANLGAAGIIYNCKDLDNAPRYNVAAILHADDTQNNCVGYPTVVGGNQAMVLNLNLSNTYGAQIAFSFSSDKIAIRRKSNSQTWTTWVAV